MSLAPCKDCGDRAVGCHDNCEKYQEWKRANDKRREKERDARIRYCKFLPIIYKDEQDRRSVTEVEKCEQKNICSNTGEHSNKSD